MKEREHTDTIYRAGPFSLAFGCRKLNEASAMFGEQLHAGRLLPLHVPLQLGQRCQPLVPPHPSLVEILQGHCGTHSGLQGSHLSLILLSLLFPASRDLTQIRGHIVYCLAITVTVVLSSLCIEVDRLHGTHESVTHAHTILHDDVEILSRNDAIPHQTPALVEQSILHPVEDKSRHLP